MSKEVKKIIYSMHPLMRKILPHIKERTMEDISKKSGLTIGETQVGIDMLAENHYVIKEKLEQTYIGLDKFGEKYIDKDLPEIKVLKDIVKGPKLMSELSIDKEEFSAAIGILKQNKLVEISKQGNEMKLSSTENSKKYLENYENRLSLLKKDTIEELLKESQQEVYNEFKSRKGFVKKIKKSDYEIIYTDKGKEIAAELISKYKDLDLIENVSSKMLKDKSWENKEFRHYDVNLDVPILDIGRRHPMIESNNIVRDIFIEMGFKEMQGPIVESEFWCFDSLWIPQDHPARDDQDTFFLEGIAEIPEHVDKVKEMHEKGIKRSHTPENGFSLDVTKRTILRTHSTATTYRYLHELGKKLKKGEDVNGKYFYCAHNFRNEAIDATHLAEFFQAEGFIIADDLSLADLMGFVKEYYAKLGIHKIRFKPTFNPYTEPSMEAHYYDEKMDKWYALINSGIFRQETLEPLGLGKKKIIAWGMGATRVAALLSGADNLRALTGVTCDFEWLRNRPIMKRSIVGGKSKMVYVYTKQSEINKYVGEELTVEDIKNTLSDMGMDIKGESEDQDPELKVEITAEKMDMISAVGIGRAIKYYRGLAKEIPKYEIKDSGLKLIVKNSAESIRPRTACALVKNVPMNEELLNEIIEIQEKMHASFGRNRKKAAIGIYPLTQIEFPITFGAEKPEDIVFKPLEYSSELNGKEILEKHDTGKKYAHLLDHCDLYPVFRDAKNKVLSMPPIINSHETGRVNVGHKDFFIECSGHNLVHLDNILKVLVTTFIDMGCTAESIEVEYPDKNNYRLDLSSYTDTVNLDYINKLIGIDVKKEEVEELAAKVMFNVKEIKDNGDITFEIPCYRNDIWHDSDIADDIARAYGYNNIIPTFPNVSSVGEHIPFSLFKEGISESLVRLGFLETYTYMLTSTDVQFKQMDIDITDYSFIKINDSAEQGLNMVRLQILPETLTTLRINRKNKYPQKIFENGLTIQPDKKSDTGARNESHLCVAIADPKANYTQIKGVLDTLFKLEGIDFKVEESELEFLIEGRRADIKIRGHNVGFIGEVHPKILDSFSLLVPVSVMEINLDKVWELK